MEYVTIMSKKEYNKKVFSKKHRTKNTIHWIIAVPGGIGILYWGAFLWLYKTHNPLHLISFSNYLSMYIKDTVGGYGVPGSLIGMLFVLLSPICAVVAIWMDRAYSRELSEEYALYVRSKEREAYQQSRGQSFQNGQAQNQKANRTVFCTNCGAQNAMDSGFCVRCGKRMPN